MQSTLRKAAEPHNPMALPLGALTVVFPTGNPRKFTPREWADLSMAVVLDCEGQQGPARDLIAELERRLGVNPAHRRAVVVGAETVRREIREARIRDKLDANRRASSLDLPVRDPQFVEAVAAKQRQAHEKRAEAASLRIIGAKLHRKAIKSLEASARRLDLDVRQLQEDEEHQDRLYGDAKEPILRAKARGEEISARDVEIAEVVRDEYGARVIHRSGPHRGLPKLRIDKQTRARKLNGLEHAFASGYLEGGHGSNNADALREVGLLYAGAYEAAEGGTSPSGEGSAGYGAKGPQLRIIEAGDRLQIMRKGLSRRQKDVLDLICGQDMRAREAATSLKAGFPATQRALRGGLEACRSSWTAALAVGRVGAEAWRVQLVDAEIKALRP